MSSSHNVYDEVATNTPSTTTPGHNATTQGVNPTTTSQHPVQTKTTNTADLPPTGGTITTSGAQVHSDDPTIAPAASRTEKVKGDFRGAINGTLGSIQAATGIVIGNEKMEQKGQAKMAEEDQRLGAKHGVMPVGSNLREQGTGTGLMGFENKDKTQE